jgi:hypothetical protein
MYIKALASMREWKMLHMQHFILMHKYKLFDARHVTRVIKIHVRKLYKLFNANEYEPIEEKYVGLKIWTFTS